MYKENVIARLEKLALPRCSWKIWVTILMWCDIKIWQAKLSEKDTPAFAIIYYTTIA